MFIVIESVYNKSDEKLSSDDIAEFTTEKEASEYIENRNSNGYAEPDDFGTYCKFHVEAI